MKKSEQINELALALSKVQGSISPAKKDSNNPYFKSKYADLTSNWESCRDQLALNQLSVVQGADDTETHLVIVTLLQHSSGQWIESRMMVEKMIADKVTKDYRKMNVQEIGATTTYLRRYAFAAIVGICTEDDDGNIASGNSQQKEQVQYFSAQQIDELQNILNKCDPGYTNWFYQNILTTYKAKRLSDLHSSLFEPMKNDSLKYVIQKTTSTIEGL